MLVLPVRKDKWLRLKVAGQTVRLCIADGERQERVRVCVDAPRQAVDVGVEPKPASTAAEGGA